MRVIFITTKGKNVTASLVSASTKAGLVIASDSLSLRSGLQMAKSQCTWRLCGRRSDRMEIASMITLGLCACVRMDDLRWRALPLPSPCD